MQRTYQQLYDQGRVIDGANSDPSDWKWCRLCGKWWNDWHHNSDQHKQHDRAEQFAEQTGQFYTFKELPNAAPAAPPGALEVSAAPPGSSCSASCSASWTYGPSSSQNVGQPPEEPRQHKSRDDKEPDASVYADATQKLKLAANEIGSNLQTKNSHLSSLDTLIGKVEQELTEINSLRSSLDTLIGEVQQ